MTKKPYVVTRELRLAEYEQEKTIRDKLIADGSTPPSYGWLPGDLPYNYDPDYPCTWFKR
jgi:hypothetical protein